MYLMKKSLLSLSALMAVFCCFLYSSGEAIAADVCSSGTGLPPFLGSGVDPNLLLMLDNSGSMLDVAYIDQDTDGTGSGDMQTQCYDEGYLLDDTGVVDNTKMYTGLFEQDNWYKWVNGIAFWQSGKLYSAGDVVLENEIYYKATKSGTSTGGSVDTDTGVTWNPIYQIDVWENGTAYTAKSYVRFEGQLYYTAEGGISSTNVNSIYEDIGAAWEAVDSTWRSGETYSSGDIVSYKGMLYKSESAATSNGDSLPEDTNVNWKLLDSGSFVPIKEVDASTACADATGAEYSSDDLCIAIDSATVDGASTPYLVTFFAAKGNFLNWASASKFDIQKSILTGGKYDIDNSLLISESRGCAGRSFIKQVDVKNSIGTIHKLTMSIDGASEDGWIDTTDDITRIAILGITADGFDVSSCQLAVEEMTKESPNQGALKGYVDACLAYSAGGNNPLADAHSAFNHSLHFCWYRQKHNAWPPGAGSVSAIENDCQKIYEGGQPSPTINPWDRSYICYGVYDPSLTDPLREGYVGRCWEPAGLPEDCEPVTCSEVGAVPQSTSSPYHDGFCGPDKYVYDCDGNFNANSGACNGNPGQFRRRLKDNLDEDDVICNQSGVFTPATWTTTPNPNSVDVCVDFAMQDYCGYLEIPEVIDPSDQASETGKYWNMPGVLIDSGVVAQLGTDRPLATLKGLIKYDLPAEQLTDAASRPDGPRGVLYEVADDLRIGVMALNDNGAKSECDPNSLSNDPSIIKYCPDSKKDGARVVAQIHRGMYVDDMGTPDFFEDDLEVWEHYQGVITAINDIRATSWTPLAEAMYSALGYYGQKGDRKLDSADFSIAADDPEWPDPVEYWCQDNNILIITEGASTADINQQVASFVNTANFNDEDTDIGTCIDGLEGSTYLDDLSWFGQNAVVTGDTSTSSNLYAKLLATNKEEPKFAKQHITTHIVTTGSLRTDGTGECSPATLMTDAADNGGSTLLSGEDPAQLEQNLRAVLSGILGRASAGSAASVISSSRSGEGAVYQAIFWPQVDRGLGEDPLTWIGDVHSLFIDDQGRMWDDLDGNGRLWSEDFNGNGRLDAGEDTTGTEGCLDGDRRIFFFYDGENTKICFNDSAWTSNPPVCDTSLTDYCDKAGEPIPIKKFDKYLWSANDELQKVDVFDLNTNRAVDASGRWIWNLLSPQRYIFTWNDLNNDGIVDSGGLDENDEIIPFVNTIDWAGKGGPVPHHAIFDDFNVADTNEMNRLVEWLRGSDNWHEDINNNGILDTGEDINNNNVLDYVYRCRRENCDPATAGFYPEWRLGDVVHSTPKLVAQPAEAFHTIYRDASYAKFVKHYRYRRGVVYFGANDGMLHAVNAGFYNDKENKFYKSYDTSNHTFGDNGPNLGSELWAYIPYNLQTHLKCLTDPLYGSGDGSSHKYFVDKEPRIFDMQIFDDDAIHPGGWGTILVGAMRFGGAPVTVGSDNRQFISAYFILDITDPEGPPKLLGEMTRTTEIDANGFPLYADLGFSTPMPTGVVMRDAVGDPAESSTKWYLVFGNGPTSIEGENTEQGKVAVLPMTLENGVLKELRIKNQPPTSTTSGVIPVLESATDTTKRFVSDMMSVDFDVEARTNPTLGALYKTDAIYFGTVDGSGFTGLPGATKWAGKGGIYRLVTRELDTTSGTQVSTTPDKWKLMKFLDTDAPVTGGLSVGWDFSNFWVYFGTGRFFDTADKTDDTIQRFFGVKEPLDANCEMTWDDVEWNGFFPNPGSSVGLRGLFRTDNIKVVEKDSFAAYEVPVIFCPSGSSTNISDLNYCDLSYLGTELSITDGIKYYSYEDLRAYIAGEKRVSSSSCPKSGLDGWYRVLQDSRERVVGQAALLGGLVTFTSYQPFDDLCTAEGMSNLYGVHYQTGTAWYENVFGTSNYDGRTTVDDKLSLGVGLATTPSMHSGGSGADAKAFVQSSTGEIIEIEQENLPIEPPKSGKQNWCDDCD